MDWAGGWFAAENYDAARFVLQRGIALVYVIAFVAALRQFRPLLGEHGLLPVPQFVARVPARLAPSLFHWRYSDSLLVAVAAVGALVAAALVARAAAGRAAVGAAAGVPRRCGCCTCPSSTSGRSSTASAGSRCCSRPASSPPSSARTGSRRR